MAQPELGSKRVCVSCGARFYDLTKDPAVCPKCGAEQPAEVPRLKRTGEIVPAAPVKAPKPKTDEDDVDDDIDIVADDDDDDDDVIEDTSDLDDDADDISSDIDVPSEKDEHDS